MAHLPQSYISTWVWALSIGAGSLGLFLTFKFKLPVIGAWSTPGVALLITAIASFDISDVIGCYVILSVVIAILGFSGVFEKIVKILPTHLLSAMIAGVLFEFCGTIFTSLKSGPLFIFPVILAYLIGRRFFYRYSVAFSVFIGILVSYFSFGFQTESIAMEIAKPIYTSPTISFSSFLGLCIPLILLSLTQHATAIQILKNAGYKVDSKAFVGFSGLFSFPLAFFGNIGINPAAIVGAMCASEECHPDPKKRYISGVICGVGYLLIGVFGSSILALFSLLPPQLAQTLAGIALLGTLIANLTSSVDNERTRDSAVVTFLVTVSGMSFFSLGSALWGLIFGAIFYEFMNFHGWKRPMNR